MAESKPIRILIADDHKLFRMGIISLLEDVDDFIIIGEVENGQELIEKFVELSPDVILVDISMPLINGIEALRAIKKINKDVRALILSMYDSDMHVYYSIKSGAKGLLSKNTMKGELVRAIKTVNDGSYYFGRSLTEEKMIELEKKYKQSIPMELDDYNQLNSKDRKILEFIGKGMTSQEIADTMKMSKKTIDYYRSGIMRRMGIKNLPELISYAVRFSTINKLFED
jgi:two-component system, NarL family, response regulator NreC